MLFFFQGKFVLVSVSYVQDAKQFLLQCGFVKVRRKKMIFLKSINKC
jgi:hypothetical protein